MFWSASLSFRRGIVNVRLLVSSGAGRARRKPFMTPMTNSRSASGASATSTSCTARPGSRSTTSSGVVKFVSATNTGASLTGITSMVMGIGCAVKGPLATSATRLDTSCGEADGESGPVRSQPSASTLPCPFALRSGTKRTRSCGPSSTTAEGGAREPGVTSVHAEPLTATCHCPASVSLTATRASPKVVVSSASVNWMPARATSETDVPLLLATGTSSKMASNSVVPTAPATTLGALLRGTMVMSAGSVATLDKSPSLISISMRRGAEASGFVSRLTYAADCSTRFHADTGARPLSVSMLVPFDAKLAMR